MTRAQVSVILVLATVLILFTIFLLVLLPRYSPIPSNSDTSVQAYVTGQLRIVADQCILELGARGGRIEPQNVVSYSFGPIELHYDDWPVLMSLDDLAIEIATCVQDRLISCSSDFSALAEVGANLSIGEPNVAVTFGERDVHIELNLTVIVTTQAGRQEFKQFAVTTPVRLKQLYEVIDATAKGRKGYERPGDFDLTYLGQQSINTTIIGSETSQLIILDDRQSRLRAGPLMFLSTSAMQE